MTCNTNYNIDNLVRSGVALAIGLPLALSVGNIMNKASDALSFGLQTATEAAELSPVEKITRELTEPCLKYMMAENDSKLEREAQNEIDDIVGGAVTHTNTCEWVL